MKSLKILKFNNFDVGWKPESPEENHPEDADLQSVCRLPLDSALGSGSGWTSLISTQISVRKPLVVESRALQCGDLLGPPRTPVFVSCKEKLLVKFASVGDRRHSSPEGEKEAGPWTGAHLPPGVFRGQVFFGNDPSSAASLRSTTRKCDKDGWLWAGGSEDPQVPTTNHARPCGKWVGSETDSGDTTVGGRADARLGPSTGAHPASNLGLPQPGVQWERSFFCCQSSFFGRHSARSWDNPGETYSEWCWTHCGPETAVIAGTSVATRQSEREQCHEIFLVGSWL